jgi:hypothetical protein
LKISKKVKKEWRQKGEEMDWEKRGGGLRDREERIG